MSLSLARGGGVSLLLFTEKYLVMKYSPELLNAEYRPSWDSSMTHSLQHGGIILLKPL